MLIERDVVIVGAGLAGVATFHALASRGLGATLIDAADDVAMGASYANGAMITPSMSDPWNGPGVGRHLAASLLDPHSAMRLRFGQLPNLARWGMEFLRNSSPSRHWLATRANFALAARSAALTRRLAEDHDLDVGTSPGGSIKVFASRGAMEGPLDLAKRLQPAGLKFQVLDAAATVALEPALEATAERIAGAIHYPDDAVGDARGFAQGLSAAARQAGGEIRLGERILRIVRNGTGFIVHTTVGSVRTRHVVLAAGVATPGLARDFGVRLPIKPAKGYSLTYRLDGAPGAPRIAMVDDAMHAAIVPLGDRIRAVGTAEFAGHDRSLDPKRLDNLAALLERNFPELARHLDRSSAAGWAGLRPMSADGRPFIGETLVPGLWVNAGHGHLGWTMMAGSARLIADLMAKNDPVIDPQPYALRGRP